MSAEQIGLYYSDVCFYCHKVVLYLQEKGVPYKPHTVDLVGSENHEPHYMRLNPQGKVPLLADGDQFIPESNDIIRYVEKKFTNYKPMLPSEPDRLEKCLSIWKLTDDLSIEVFAYGCMAFPQYVKNPKYPKFMAKRRTNSMQKGSLVKRMEKMRDENPDLREAYEAKIQKTKNSMQKMFSEEEVVKEIERTEVYMTKIEEQLQQMEKEFPDSEHWLVSADFTVADVMLAMTLGRLDWMGFSDRFWGPLSSRPLVARYFSQLLLREPYQDVCVRGMAIWRQALTILKRRLPWRSLLTGAVLTTLAAVYMNHLLH